MKHLETLSGRPLHPEVAPLCEQFTKGEIDRRSSCGGRWDGSG